MLAPRIKVIKALLVRKYVNCHFKQFIVFARKYEVIPFLSL
jgi:hypothetical protein